MIVLFILSLIVTLTLQGYHFTTHVAMVQAAHLMGSYMENAGQKIDGAMGFIADRMVYAASKVRFVQGATVLSEGLNVAIHSLDEGMSKASKTGGNLIRDGMLDGSSTLSTKLVQAANTVAQSIFLGFDEVKAHIDVAYDTLQLRMEESTLVTTEQLTELMQKSTNEILLTTVSLSFIFIPVLLVMYILLNVNEKDFRSVFSKVSFAMLVACGLCAFVQYLRFAFSHTFSIENITIAFFCAFYAFVAAMYFVYVFFYEIRTVWKYTKLVLNALLTLTKRLWSVVKWVCQIVGVSAKLTWDATVYCVTCRCCRKPSQQEIMDEVREEYSEVLTDVDTPTETATEGPSAGEEGSQVSLDADME